MKTIHKSLLIIMLLGLTNFAASPVFVHAQAPGENEPIVIAPSGRLSLTFEQLGYDTKDLDRYRNNRYYTVNLPGNFQISPTGNYLDLITYHLPEIPDKPSVLKVTVNGRLLSSFPLTKSNAISNTVRITLPEDLLRAGYNSIKIELNTSDTCEDPGAIVNVFIDQASSISFGYQQIPYLMTDLSLYPWPFTEIGLLKIPVTIVLPDSPTADILSVAATIAAGLGQMSGGDIDLTATLASNLDPDTQNNNHFIVIGKPDDNILFDELELPLPVDNTIIEPGQGILEEIVSPWNEFRLMLIVSGLDDESVLKAGHALSRQAHFLDMRGPIAIVTQLRLSPDEPDTPSPPSMTLASLGYEDETAYGAKPQDYTYDFVLPLGWQLAESPSFVLKFAHADMLDPYKSVIDISLNGVPIGSTLLDDTNTDEGELTVSLPARRLQSGRNRLNIGIEMNFPDSDNLEKCRVLGDERAWMVINSESEIFLPYNTIDLPPNLSLFPYPFSQYFGLDQTLLVLPDQPSEAIFNHLIQLAIRLGSPIGTEYISAHVAYASQVTQETWQDHHLILLGRPTENAILGELNSYLPHPFVAGSDILEPLIIDSVAFSPDPNRDAGLLEIAASPWRQDYALLAITGTTDGGVQLAIQALLEQTGQLQGNLAVIEPAAVPFSNESEQLGIYAIDTRSPVSTTEATGPSEDELSSKPEKETSSGQTIAENTENLLAERWWK
jgi:hypothetical protein